MKQGGKRKGAGRKPAPNKLKKMTIKVRPDQTDKLNLLPRRTKNKFIRSAIDLKFEQIDKSGVSS